MQLCAPRSYSISSKFYSYRDHQAQSCRATIHARTMIAMSRSIGMHGKKNSTFPIDRDIANRLGIVEDFFELQIAYARRFRQVTIRVSTPVAHAQNNSRKQCKRQQK